MIQIRFSLIKIFLQPPHQSTFLPVVFHLFVPAPPSISAVGLPGIMPTPLSSLPALLDVRLDSGFDKLAPPFSDPGRAWEWTDELFQ